MKPWKARRGYLSIAERIRFRYRLFWKYGNECAYCHRFYDWRHELTIDHVQPLSRGGALRDLSNMVLACTTCNTAKGNQWEHLTLIHNQIKEPTARKRKC